MTEPKLTIGIPHKDRSDHLQHAIDSALAQTVPVRIVVADQGKTERTGLVMGRYAEHPNVLHLPTGATCLWENWRAVAEGCRTPYFAWLQDDDVVSRVYASRVIQAFDASPQALHFQARCYCSPDRRHALWWGVNGPQWGLDMIDLRPESLPGSLVLASMYLVSWALSPGVAFRCGPEFSAALEGMPSHCDLFAERLILAAMAAQGPLVIDPVTAGYWHHWGGNESYRQNADGSLPAQMTVMVEHLDCILDNSPGWEQGFLLWCGSRSPVEILGWLANFPAGESRHCDALKMIMSDSLQGRIEAVPGPAQPDVEPVVIWEDAA